MTTKKKLSIALIMLGALHLIILFAGFISPYDPESQNRDLPFAPQSASVAAFLILMMSTPRLSGPRAVAETMAAAVLALSACYIAFNESFANWQAIWLCAGLVGLAFILARARDVPG